MFNSWIISFATGMINQTSQNTELPITESSIKTFSDIALIITGIFTVILVLVLIWQTKILKTQVGEMKKQTENILEESKLHRTEIESTIRPWIGIIGNPQFNGALNENSLYRIYLQNWGRIPPKQLYVYIRFSKSQILLEHVKKMKGLANALGTLLPNDTTGFNCPLNTQEFNKTREGIDKIWFSVLVEYNYGNNLTGDFCAIYTLNTGGAFEQKEQWAT